MTAGRRTSPLPAGPPAPVTAPVAAGGQPTPAERARTVAARPTAALHVLGAGATPTLAATTTPDGRTFVVVPSSGALVEALDHLHVRHGEVLPGDRTTSGHAQAVVELPDDATAARLLADLTAAGARIIGFGPTTGRLEAAYLASDAAQREGGGGIGRERQAAGSGRDDVLVTSAGGGVDDLDSSESRASGSNGGGQSHGLHNLGKLHLYLHTTTRNFVLGLTMGVR